MKSVKLIAIFAMIFSILNIDEKVNASAGFVSFDGADINTQNTFTYDGDDLLSNPRTLVVNASFGATTATKRLEIDLNNVLELEAMPGFIIPPANSSSIANHKGWTFDINTLQSQYIGVIINGRIVQERVDGYLTGAAKVVYEINSTVDSFTLEGKLLLNPVYGYARTYSNPLIVTTYVNDAVVDSENILSLSINSNHGTKMGNREMSGEVPALPGQSVRTQINFQQLVYTGNLSVNGNIIKQLDMTFKIPKELGFTHIDKDTDQDGVDNSNAGTYSYTVDRSQANFDYVYFKANSLLTIEDIYFYYTLANDIPDGIYRATESTGFTVTMPDGSTYSDPKPSVLSFTNYILVNSTVILTVEPFVETNAFHDPYELNRLGGVAVYSSSANVLSNQKARIDFVTSNDNVYLVDSLKILSQSGIENIQATSTLGNIYTMADTASTNVKITREKLGITNANEYIAYLDFDFSGSYEPGWKPNNTVDSKPHIYSRTVQFYGKFINPPLNSAYYANFEIENTAYPGSKEITLHKYNYTTERMTSGGLDPDFPEQMYASKTYNVSAETVYGGTNYGGIMPSLEGIAIYVRDSKYGHINPSSFVVNYGDTVYQVGNAGMVVTRGVDNTGYYFYRVELPEVQIGYGLVNYPSATINFDITVTSVTPTVSFNIDEIIKMMPIDNDIVVNNTKNNGMSKYTSYDTYNLTGNNDANLEMMGSLNSDVSTILKDSSLLVETTVSFEGSPWQSYDYDTNLDIVPVGTNPTKTTRYRLDVVNNSDNVIPMYGSYTLIPIPKYQENTPLMPSDPADYDPLIHMQKEKFNWTLNLVQEPTVVIDDDLDITRPNYTYEYATTYETDPFSTKFVPWSAIGDKSTIRMVKISTEDSLEAGLRQHFEVPMVVDTAGVSVASIEGTTNIYSSKISSPRLNAITNNVALILQTGTVSGTVFNDNNKNGINDTGDTPRGGVTVAAYSTGRYIESTITNPDGTYEFNSFNAGEIVEIKVNNPSIGTYGFSEINPSGSVVTPIDASHSAAAKLGVVAGTDSFNVDAGIIEVTKMTFDGMGGVPNLVEKVGFDGYTTTPPVVVKEGHTFVGWFTDPTAGTQVTSFVFTKQDVTYYARYTINNYNITFNDKDGVLIQGPTSYLFDSVVTAPAAPVISGLKFVGWIDADGIVWDFSVDRMPAKDLVVKALYEAVPFVATFTVDSVPVKQELVDFGALVPEPATDPIKIGYTFVNWTYNGTPWNFATDTMPAMDIELVANFTPNSYNATFIYNPILATPNVTTPYNFGSLVTPPSPDPSLAGYTFIGWRDGLGKMWDFAVDTMPAMDVIFTIVYEIDDFTVTYVDANWGSNRTDQVQYQSLVPEVPNGTPAANEAFIGWVDDTGKYWDFTNNTMPASNLTLTAVYQVIDVAVTFHYPDGFTITEYYNQGNLVTQPNPNTVSGYTITNWYTDSALTNLWNFTTDTVGTVDLDLYADYTVNDYTVTYIYYDGTSTTEQVPYKSMVPEKVAPSITGYDFVGWYLPTNTPWDFTTPMPNGDITLVAIYRIQEYTVTYDDTINTPSTTVQQYGTLLTPPANPVKPGYTFLYWAKDGVEWEFGFQTMPAEDITLTAVYEGNIHTVTFDNTITKPRVEEYRTGDIIVKPVNPYKPGYTFLYWAKDGVEWNFTTPMPDEDIVLTAVYKLKDYNVTFNDMIGNYDTYTYSYGSFIVKPTNPFNRGFKFIGWYDENDELWNFESNTMPRKDIELYAKYQAIPYVATFIGPTDSAQQIYYYQDRIIEPTPPYLEGHKFLGWIYYIGRASFSSDYWDFTNRTMPAADITFKAMYEIEVFTVTFYLDDGTTVYKQVEVNYNDLVAMPVNPVREGYKFLGWYDENGNPFDPQTQIKSDLKIYAKWEKLDDGLVSTGSTSYYSLVLLGLLMLMGIRKKLRK